VSLYRSPSGVWRSTILDGEPWIEHAFGTAQAQPEFEYLVLQQVHGISMVDAEFHRPGCEGDALVANQPGRFVAVKSADCIPLLVADPECRVVAAVHGGWRGTLAGIAGNVVKELVRRGANPARLVAAAGPCIRACCFEVGPEVSHQFQNWFPERDDLGDRARIDLIEATRRQLLLNGLNSARLDLDGPCTVCGGREFHSWRRDRQTGARMFSAIGLLQA